MTSTTTPREKTAPDRGLVWLVGAAAAMGGSVVTLPLLPPLSAVLAAAGLGLSLLSRRAGAAGRARLVAAIVAVLSATLLVVSAGISSAMTVTVSPAEPSQSIPASPVSDPD